MSTSAYFSNPTALRAAFAGTSTPVSKDKAVEPPAAAAAVPAKSTDSLPASAARPTTTVGSGLTQRTASTNVTTGSARVTTFEYTKQAKSTDVNKGVFQLISEKSDIPVSAILALGTEAYVDKTVTDLKEEKVVDMGDLCKKVRPGEFDASKDLCERKNWMVCKAVFAHGCTFSYLVPSMASIHTDLHRDAETGSLIEVFEASKDSYDLFKVHKEETAWVVVKTLAKIACTSVLRNLKCEDDEWVLDEDSYASDSLISTMLALWKQANAKSLDALKELQIPAAKALTVYCRTHKITINSTSNISFEAI
ncbi:hypothetical protein HXX76_014133 [Chlamydomonas incerta]|uniref:Uncharacterized protein n=1 Tax=Chlamydomonas incerta TaxID=51695 RepID=A0A835VRD8_CHLIN|nr:hypothetical protein HXX76_014133 [Chlamydomonas incerta]|eukprot:KAG2424975.1 hypothetical protein HXX76_014133 [Chlamydomonas incerta]